MKRIVSVIVALMLLCGFSIGEANEPITIYYNGITATASDTVNINVCIKNNTGMAGLLLNFEYDSSKLQINSITNGSAFASALFTLPDMSTQVNSPFTVSWISLDGLSGDGTILTIQATVLSGSFENAFPVEITNYEASDINEQNVSIAIDNGAMPYIAMTDAECTSGETIDVPIKIFNNPGISALSVDVTYDTAVFTLDSIENSSIFTGAQFEAGDTTKSTVNLNWVSLSNSTANGAMAVFRFTAKENAAPGDHPILLSVKESINVSENEVPIYNKNSKITVREVSAPETVLYSGTATGSINWYLYSSGKLLVTGSGSIPNYTAYSGIPWYQYRGSITKIEVSGDIATIGNRAFIACENVTSVIFFADITGIGNQAFKNCISLPSAYIPNTVTTIGDSAFDGCTVLNKVSVYSKDATFGDACFDGCLNLSLHGYAASTAEEYAETWGINFIALQQGMPVINVTRTESIASFSYDIVVENLLENATLFCSFYDSKHTLVYISSEKYTGATTLIVPKTLGAAYGKVFVWSSSRTMRPLAKSLNLIY